MLTTVASTAHYGILSVGANQKKYPAESNGKPLLYHPKNIMTDTNTNDTANGVNGNSHRIASPGRDCHVRQVIPDRHPATVRNNTTLKVATWNVRTLFQNGKFDNVKQ